MEKATKSKRTPSRRHYEERHPTRSCRLNKEDNELLEEHLEHTGRSFADFVKDHLREEKNMVNERIEMLASKQVDPSFEDRIRCLEDLVHGIFCLGVDHHEYPPYCPRCEGQELFICEGREMESNIAHPWVPTWKCPRCGYFINTYKRIDSKSITRIDADMSAHIDKPKNVRSPRGNKQK